MDTRTLKKEIEAKHTALFNECSLFWAFSNQQFTENKTPLKEGEKYVSIGHGGYLPKGQLDIFLNGMADIKKWEKEQKKAMKAEEREKCILYELNNYECFYTQDIEDALPALLPHFTLEEIQAVYNKNLQKELEANY